MRHSTSDTAVKLNRRAWLFGSIDNLLLPGFIFWLIIQTDDPEMMFTVAVGLLVSHLYCFHAGQRSVSH
jgi:hypothetical protein